MAGIGFQGRILFPVLVRQGLFIGLTQALETLRIFIRAGLLQQLGVVALDGAGISGDRQAE